MLFQASCNPAAPRLKAWTERHDIILASLLYAPKLTGDFLKAGHAFRGKLVLVLGQALTYSPPPGWMP